MAHITDFTSTSELLLFTSFSDRVLVQDVSQENDLIFMRMNEQLTYISFCTKTLVTEANVNLELANSSMSCHRRPLIFVHIASQIAVDCIRLCAINLSKANNFGYITCKNERIGRLSSREKKCPKIKLSSKIFKRPKHLQYNEKL